MDNLSDGLTLLKTKSKVETYPIFNDLDSIKRHIKAESDVVVYFDNEVLIGRYNRNFSFSENKIIENAL